MHNSPFNEWPDPRIIFRVHAIQKMYARGISEVEVRTVLQEGDAIEEHPDALPYPSVLLLAWVDNRPIHVVAARIGAATIAIVTVYEPDLSRWEPGFRTRKHL